MAANPQTSSRLLMLAPELRNQIYQLVFPPAPCSTLIELHQLCSYAPPKDPILTCRQIFEEAEQIYKSSFRHYVMTDLFAVPPSVDAVSELRAARSNACKEADLAHITTLVTYARSKSGGRFILRLTPLTKHRWFMSINKEGRASWGAFSQYLEYYGTRAIPISPDVEGMRYHDELEVIEALVVPARRRDTYRAQLADVLASCFIMGPGAKLTPRLERQT